ncbi:MAG: DHH family phosphoesterase [Thermofilaceae archaeon]|nr:DHH family phosphoesterase [Thermofilaceae archaeon]
MTSIEEMSFVVAHSDLDGLASAAVIMAALRNVMGIYNPEIILSQPYTLNRVLLKLSTLSVRILVITDLGIDETIWSTIADSVKTLTSKNCRILWIDHHVNTIKLASHLARNGVSLLYTNEGCSSTIAREMFAHLTEDPKFFTRLAKMGEIADSVYVDDEGLSILTDRLVAAISAPSSKDDFKTRLVKMWIEDKRLITDDVALKAEEFEKELLSKLDGIKERIILEVERGIIIDARGMRLSGLAGHIASYIARKKGKVTLVVFSPNPREAVATCRVPPRIEFNILSELVPIVLELGGSGGGLFKAAALRIPSAVGDLFVKRVCEVFRSKLD